jgi:hypothetical protein
MTALSFHSTSSPSLPLPTELAALIAAHKASSLHLKQLAELGVRCGCFQCCQTFAPSCITEWVDQDEAGSGQTARGPLCGIDSVIGSNSGYPITTGFLSQMKLDWLGER